MLFPELRIPDAIYSLSSISGLLFNGKDRFQQKNRLIWTASFTSQRNLNSKFCLFLVGLCSIYSNAKLSAC